MLAEQRLQEMLTNNLANAETPGFKASDGSLLAFPDVLLQRLQYGTDAGTGTGTNNVVGTLGQGVVLQEGIPVFSQGTTQSTGRLLDVAIVDGTPAGQYGVIAGAGGVAGAGAAGGSAGAGNGGGQALASVRGTVTVGPGGRLEIQGQPLAVVDANGNPMNGVYVAKNPAYQGTGLLGADGAPVTDAKGNTSYIYVNAQGAQVGVPGKGKWQGVSPRIGSQDVMGDHSFFPVAYGGGATPGLALSRDGHLNIDAQHNLVDASGSRILPIDANGRPILGASIRMNPNYHGTSLFNTDGTPVVDNAGQPSYTVVSQTSANVAGARLGTVDADVTTLAPLGQSEFMVGGTLNAAQVMPQLKVSTGTIQPGSLEQSNVDQAATLTQMMAVVAQYEANQRMLQTQDQELAKAVEDVGKVNA